MATKRVRRTPEEAESEILAAAEAFLATRDFRDLSVDELMGTTGMARSAFYHYFSDRGALIVRMLEGIEIEMEGAVEIWMANPEEDPVKAVQDAIRQATEIWSGHRHVLRAVHAGSFTDPAIEHQYRSVLLRRLIGIVDAVLQRERSAGRTRIDDPAEVARSLVLMNVAVFAERLGAEPPDSAADVSRVLGRIWTGAIYPDAVA